MEHALVIQAARFGDLVETKRLILSLKAHSTVSLVVDRTLADLAHILYPDTTIYGFPFHGKLEANDIGAIHETIASLANIPFARIYNCNFSPLTEAFCRAFDPKTVYGYRPAIPKGLLRSPLLTMVSRITRCRTSACINIEDVWAHADTEHPPLDPSLVNPRPKGDGKGIGVVIAGRESRRSLPPTLLADIVRVYANLYGAKHIVLLGTAFDKQRSHELRRALPSALQALVLDLCGKTTWPDLVEALTGLDLLITPDTGTMHLAAHLGVPVCAFFLSSASVFETGPYGIGHTIWQAMPSCHPCLEKSPCPAKTACLSLFAQPTFLRTLVAQHTAKAVALPEGLVCLTSTTDALGVTYRPVLGSDPQKILRQAERDFVSHTLLGTPFPASHLSPSTQAELALLFSPDQDWMLDNPQYQ
ncbi:MAG: glycosyltransferase family 9 protein [Desulfovibrio sp.]|nr:glycosyltransferase family 9 protein [Desulfovibrio sp.]